MLFRNLFFVIAHGEEDFTQVEKIMLQISCDNLTEADLEALGKYFMKQMYSGEQHEYMDEMMGGEESNSLEQTHIAMAYRFYCNEGTSVLNYQDYGMMGMMNNGRIMGYPCSPSRNIYTWLMFFALSLIVVLLVILIFKQTKKK